jgi:PEGA domain
MNLKFTGHQAAARCRRAVWIALVLLGCAVSEGCVHRRFTVRSNPPGARVFVDNYEIGTTPVSHDFVYYGTRKIRLVKDGYETLTILQPMPTPWWDLPGIDFVSENLIPNEIHDHRVLDYQLQPQVIVPTEQLLGRADELRRTRNPNTPGGAPASGAIPNGSTGTLPPPGSVPMNAPQGVPPQGEVPQFVTPQNPGPPNTQPPTAIPPHDAGLGKPGGSVSSLPVSAPAYSTAPPPTGAPPAKYQPPSY